MMATVELSQAGDSSILNLYQAGNSGNIRNEQKAIHFASCQAISQSKTGHKNAVRLLMVTLQVERAI